MLNTLLFFGWVVIAFVVVWKRVRITVKVSYGGSEPRKVRGGKSGLVRVPKSEPSSTGSTVLPLVSNYGGGSHGTKVTALAARAMISPTSTPEDQTASTEDCLKQDCISALVNLGCDRKQARAAVERAFSQGPAEFDELLKRAIQEAA